MSVDSLAEDFKYLTTYQYASNSPIWAIDLDGLEAFIIHGTGESNNPRGNRFTNSAKDELQRISNNTQRDESFRWDSKVLNSVGSRRYDAKKLVKHVTKVRKEMIANGTISSDEGISFIGYSHGGNVAIQAAKMLNTEFEGTKVNLVTVSTPAQNNSAENPKDNPGINEHIQIVHENDIVAGLIAGDENFDNEKTKEVIIKSDEIDLGGPIDSHINLPNSSKFGDFLKKITQLKKAPKPTTLDSSNN